MIIKKYLYGIVLVMLAMSSIAFSMEKIDEEIYGVIDLHDRYNSEEGNVNWKKRLYPVSNGVRSSLGRNHRYNNHLRGRVLSSLYDTALYKKTVDREKE